jgi:hypothetical protein
MMHALGRLAISAIAAWLLWEVWRAFSQGSIHSYGALLRRDKKPARLLADRGLLHVRVGDHPGDAEPWTGSKRLGRLGNGFARLATRATGHPAGRPDDRMTPQPRRERMSR